MPNESPYLDQSRLLRYLSSPLFIRLSRFFIIRWLIDIVVSVTSKRYKTKLSTKSQGSRLESTLDIIVRDVVEDLGYVGAMVATREDDDSLPVRAFYVDPDVMAQDEIEMWERRLSTTLFREIGLKAPSSRAYINNKRFRNNLSVRAVMAEGGPRIITHHELFSLFTPVVPTVFKPIITWIQKNKLGVTQVAAVPFFLQDEASNRSNVVGNLFVLARSEISGDGKKRLAAFGRMAAITIENERRLQQESWLNGQVQALQSTIYKMQTSLSDEQEILESIVEGVVKNLGYVGAMVATREENTLPVKAYCVNPDVISASDIKKWETRLSLVVGTDIGLKAPIARTYLEDERFKKNLSYRAVNAAEGPHPVPDKELFSLFVPVVPEALRGAMWRIQKTFDIGQVIAVPFFLEEDGEGDTQVIGNLFVVSKDASFKSREIELLQTFAQQAAIGIRNAQQHRKNAQQYLKIQALQQDIALAYEQEKKRREEIQLLQEEIAIAYEEEKRRRADAEKLNKMASLVANARHNIAGELDLLSLYTNRALKGIDEQSLPPNVSENLNKNLNKIVASINDAQNMVRILRQESTKLLEAQEKPESIIPDELQKRDIHGHITEAIATANKLERLNVKIVQELFNKQVFVWSDDRLTEVFVILLNNAADELNDAVLETGRNENNKITIASQIIDDKWIVVSVSDTGRGVKEEYREKIFENEFTTKGLGESGGSGGLGNGLFLAKRTVTELRGELWLAQPEDPAPGATFVVKLPIVNSK